MKLHPAAQSVRLGRRCGYSVQLIRQRDRCRSVNEQCRHGEPAVGVGLVHVRQEHQRSLWLRRANLLVDPAGEALPWWPRLAAGTAPAFACDNDLIVRSARESGGGELVLQCAAACDSRTWRIWSLGIIAQYFSGKTLPPIDRFDVLIRLLGASPAEQGGLATARDRLRPRRGGLRRPDAAAPPPVQAAAAGLPRRRHRRPAPVSPPRRPRPPTGQRAVPKAATPP